jgi:hypothetical protein
MTKVYVLVYHHYQEIYGVFSSMNSALAARSDPKWSIEEYNLDSWEYVPMDDVPFRQLPTVIDK